MDNYPSDLTPDQRRTLERWHESAYRELRARGEVEVDYLGRRFVVPADVFGPTPTSDMLGQAVLDEVRPTDRVLDMGTGCGVNAILAASAATDVTAVDINEHAVAAARANAERNGVAERVRCFTSDVFEKVDGDFDLMVIDPPFRWLNPRDVLEASMADPGYAALTRFMEQAPARLRPGGRILLFFGTSGDMAYLERLIEATGLDAEVLEKRGFEKEGVQVEYVTRCLRAAGRD